MKQSNLAILAAIVAMAAGTALTAYGGTAATTGVVGSVHDITAYAATKGGAVQADNEARVCIFCHTPHHASTDLEANGTTNPLWNHKVTTQTYQPYKTATFDSTPFLGSMANGGDPLIGSSRLCMSCHDGSVALDQHDGEGAQTGGAVLSGNKVVGSTTSTTSDHPIGINYVNIQAADPTKYRSSGLTWIGGNGHAVGESLEVGGYLTCSTCHDVHNKKNVVQNLSQDAVLRNPLTRAKQTGSALCRSCHSL